MSFTPKLLLLLYSYITHFLYSDSFTDILGFDTLMSSQLNLPVSDLACAQNGSLGLNEFGALMGSTQGPNAYAFLVAFPVELWEFEAFLAS